METLSKDVRRQLALQLSPPDLINFCLTSKENHKEICNSKDFWRQKLSADYPEFFHYYQVNNLTFLNPKNTYIRRFTEISREIENFLDENSLVMNRKELYNKIYNFYVLTRSSQNPEKNYKLYFSDLVIETELATGVQIDFKRQLGLLIARLLKKDNSKVYNIFNSQFSNFFWAERGKGEK